MEQRKITYTAKMIDSNGTHEIIRGQAEHASEKAAMGYVREYMRHATPIEGHILVGRVIINIVLTERLKA